MIIFCWPVPCESGYMYDCNSGECQQCPHGSYQPQWGQTRSGQPCKLVHCTRVTCFCLFTLPIHVCSCWPCPANTTTDGPGAASLDMCKSHSCPFYAKEGVGIMESPNYPRQFPVITVKILCFATKIFRQTGAECRWRVSPGHTRRVLLILPRLALPPDCSASFTVSRWGSQ